MERSVIAMTSSKKRNRARRHAERQMEQAWEAVAGGNLVLAAKLAARAIDAGSVNARLWLDHGLVLEQCGRLADAEESLRMAISLAPTYAEAFAQLARLQAVNGKLVQAVRLQRRAVELAPDAAGEAALAGYEALLPDAAAHGGSRSEGQGDGAPAAPAFTERTERFDWDGVRAELAAHGAATLPELLSVDECEALAALWDEEHRFEHRVVCDDVRGIVAYRFFAVPLPDVVARLREEVYARLAPIADEWAERLGSAERYPAQLSGFLARCRDAGQYRSTPILLRYVRGGFNAPHRDVAGRVVFPFQLAVTLGPGSSADGGGGALRLVDDRPGKKMRERRYPTRVGDGIAFCTRVRLVEVGGALGLQPVRHGVTEVTAASRFALGVPFHEHG